MASNKNSVCIVLAAVVVMTAGALAGCEIETAALDGAPVGLLPGPATLPSPQTSLHGDAWGPSYRWVGFHEDAVTDMFAANRCPAPVGTYAAQFEHGPLYDHAALRARYAAILAATSPIKLKPGFWTAQVTAAMQAVGPVDLMYGDGTSNGLFCVYEYVGPQDVSPSRVSVSLPPSNGQPPSAWLERDVMSLVGQKTPSLPPIVDPCTGLDAQALSDGTNAALAKVARQKAGAWVEAWPYDASSIETHVAVIDSVPDTWDGEPLPAPVTNAHGLGVMSWIRQLACPDNSIDCPVEIDAYLALDLVFDEATGEIAHDTTNGGHFGYNTVLAAKIHEATMDWLILRPATRQVINLSVGSEPNISTLSATGPVLESLTAALEHASCRGAFVSAAAGNHPGAGATHYLPGATIPGAFEAVGAPEPSDSPGTLACVSTSAQPLVTMTAFGLIPSDYLIPITRDEGVSPQGAHAVQIPINSRFLTPGATVDAFDGYSMSGTSMAAGVVSAGAAVLFALDDGVDAAQIREDLRASGINLGKDLEADFWLGEDQGAPDPDVKKISICSAVDLLVGFDCAPPTGGSSLPTTAQVFECFVDVAGDDLQWDDFDPDSTATWNTIDTSALCGPGAEFLTSQDVASLADFQAANPGFEVCPEMRFFNNTVGEHTYPQPRIPDPGGGDAVFDVVGRDLYVVANPAFLSAYASGTIVNSSMWLRLYYGRSGAYLAFPITSSFVVGQPSVFFNLAIGSVVPTSGRLIGTVWGNDGTQHSVDQIVVVVD